MSSDDWQMSRRRVLRTSGAGVAGLLITGVANAKSGKGNNSGNGHGQGGPPEHVNSPDWIQAKHGQLKLTIEKSEWNSTDLRNKEGIPDDVRPVSYETVQNAVVDFNKAIADDDLVIEERNGRKVCVPNFDKQVIKGADK